MEAPGAVVDGHHGVPRLVAPEGAQARQVVLPVGVDRHDLLGRRTHDEAVVAVLRLDDPAQLLGVDPAGQHVGAPHPEGGEGGHQGGHVEHRTGVQVDGLLGDALDHGHHHVLGQDRPVGQLGPVGDPPEGPGVELDHRGVRVDGDAGVRGGPRGQEGLVARVVPVDVSAGPVVLQPEGLAGPEAPGLGDLGADLLVLPDDDLGPGVVEEGHELLGALAPVGRGEDRSELGGGQEALHQAVAVLAEPEHDVAGPDPPGRQGVGQPVGPLVELGIGEALVAADQPEGPRAAPPVLGEDVGQGQVVQGVHVVFLCSVLVVGCSGRRVLWSSVLWPSGVSALGGPGDRTGRLSGRCADRCRGEGASGAAHGPPVLGASSSRRRSSGFTTLPVALRGSSSTTCHWRGTL